jgi:redox-sensitive bicupin YhaK (pirin superfamily)
MSIEVRRAGERFVTVEKGRVTRHSFSFGPHYDPANLGFGLLVSHNDDLLAPGSGYPDHPHQETEIVTWVLSGALAHSDSSGRSGLIVPGQIQVMSAGTGIVHSEMAEPGAGPTRFVQTWVRPDSWGSAPRYASAEVSPGAGWTAVASGARAGAGAGAAGWAGRGALPIGSRGATLWVADALPGARLTVPDVPHAHLFVATGAVVLDLDADVVSGRSSAAGGDRGVGRALRVGTNLAAAGPEIGTNTEGTDPFLRVGTDPTRSEPQICTNTQGVGQYPRAEVRIGEGDAVRFRDRGADLVVTEPGQLMLWTFA